MMMMMMTTAYADEDDDIVMTPMTFECKAGDLQKARQNQGSRRSKKTYG